MAVLVFCTALLVINGCTGWLAQAIVWGPNTGKVIDPDADPEPEVYEALGVDQQLRIDVGPPEASLAVWVMEPKPAREPRGTVIVLHGINSGKDRVANVGFALARAGYRSVCVDLRSHGYSSGQFLTFGVLDSADLVQVTDSLRDRGLLSGELGVYGSSYGGAVAIEYAAVDPRVRAVVAVAPFASLREVTPGMVHRYAPWPARLFLFDSTIQRAITRAGWIGNFDPDRASPVEAIQKTSAQVLLMHGRDDVHIPSWQSQQLHDAARSHSQLILRPGRDHGTIMSDRIVRSSTLDWFDRYLAPTPTQPSASVIPQPGQSSPSPRS
jgi:pimeloyl-ACP methyl ester carboxylesterase